MRPWLIEINMPGRRASIRIDAGAVPRRKGA
jgi:hypothetical protein